MEPKEHGPQGMGPEGDEEEFDEAALRAESDELLELRYLTGANAVFQRTPGGFVSLDYKPEGKEEKHYDRIGAYRTFPMSAPEEFISIREADEKAKEIGVIRALKDLPKEQAAMIEEQLKMRYFTPTVLKVLDVKEEYGHAYFTVQTDYGAARFTTHMGSDAVLLLADDKVQITDLDGNRYIIPDYNNLSVTEKKKLDMFI